MTISPEQCRAARIMLKWRQPDLADASGVGMATISDFERGARNPRASTLQTLRATLEAAGIVFTDGDKSTGPGLHLRDPQED